MHFCIFSKESSFFSPKKKMMNRIKCVTDYFKPGTFLYSGLFGAAVGTGLAGSVYGTRAFHVMLFDEEHFRVSSRQRYLEKQYLFFKQLQV